MNPTQFDTLIKQLEPAQALSAMARAIKECLPLLREEEQRRFVMDLFGTFLLSKLKREARL